MSSATLSKKQELITILCYNGAIVTEFKLPRFFCCRNPRPRTGDDFPAGLILRTGHISIHVPRTGGRQSKQKAVCLCLLFQFTSPARGTTYASFAESPRSRFQSASPAWGTTFSAPSSLKQDYLSKVIFVFHYAIYILLGQFLIVLLLSAHQNHCQKSCASLHKLYSDYSRIISSIFCFIN